MSFKSTRSDIGREFVSASSSPYFLRMSGAGGPLLDHPHMWANIFLGLHRLSSCNHGQVVCEQEHTVLQMLILLAGKT